MRAMICGLLALAAASACAAPPAKVEAGKKARAVALKNPGFEAAPRKAERCPEGWECTMHADPESFSFKVQTTKGAEGKQALCVERVTHEPWGLVTQSVPATGLHGATLRFSVALRVDRADGAGGGPWAVVHGPSGNLVHEERILKATKDWERVSVDFPVGAGAQVVEVGATLQGGGRICIDEARLEVRAP